MKIKYILPVICIIFCNSCVDFLDESNPSNFTQENYFKNAEHARSVVNAIYQDFQMAADNDYGGSPYFMTDFATGLAGTRVGQNQQINKVRMCINDSDNGYSKSWWNYSYRAIANANLAITYIPNIEMDETEKSKCLGEAYCLRAYHYFNLVRLFGAVPLVLVPIDASSPDLYPKQSEMETIYSQIVNDLLEAEKSSLPWEDTSGHITMAVIKTLLAQVYMTMAGYPLQKGNDYYVLAAQKAKEVIDKGCCKLFESYDQLHDISYENRDEHMLMIQYQSGVTANGLQYLYLPYNLDISYYSTETGSIYAINEFIDSYENGDKRIEEGQFYYTKYTLNADRSKEVNFGAYYIYKFFDKDAHLNTAQSSMNYPLLRYADLLLLCAEAENEINASPSDAAYQMINMIRERANLQPLKGLSKNQFREAVWKERYHELAFENKIWFDMVRTRKVLNLETCNFDDFVGHKFSYGPILGEKELLFPIPTSEMNNNKNLIQNLGY